MPGYLAGAPGIIGPHTRHAATLPIGRIILIGLIVIVAIVLLLAIPVWWGAGFDSFTRGMSKAARPTFVFGFGVLIVGLASGVRIIDIAGGAVMAAVVLGVIVENYLIRDPRPGAASSAGMGPRRAPGSGQRTRLASAGTRTFRPA